ncbi:MAG: hypothetical protein HY557_03265 [Euryarchaeota archaeon]|nr:hypothetical protein [Euryarchaeota archaeon]
MVFGVGLLLVVARLAVVLFSSQIVQQFGPSTSSGGFGNETAGFFLADPNEFYIQTAVMGLGLALVGLGGNTLCTVYHQSVRSYLSAAKAPPARGPAPPDLTIEQVLGRFAPMSPAKPPTPVVKVKCRSCGILQDEDAEFCNKCGQRTQPPSMHSSGGRSIGFGRRDARAQRNRAGCHGDRGPKQGREPLRGLVQEPV